MKNVTVAMSGGVDSAAACAMLKENGYNVRGATMRLGVENDADIEAARLVCDALGIDFEVYDFRELFKERVINPFCKNYIENRTPNPCINCNIDLKFGAFAARAFETGADVIATGHYARIENGMLLKAKNKEKDQSYVLYGMKKDIISRVLFPLGDFESKDEVRAYVEKFSLPCAKRPESQDICFIPDGDYAKFLEGNGYTTPKGQFVDINGNVLGCHLGCHRYTIGQRRGLGVSAGKRIFVVEKRSGDNNVVLGNEEDLYKNEILCTDVNFLADVSFPLTAEVKTRYRKNANEAVIEKVGENTVKCTFISPERAPCPGQSAVFYDGERVLGGGIIV